MNRFNKNICILLIPSFLVFACTFTYKKTDNSENNAYYEKINTYGKRFRTYVTLNSEEEYHVEDLLVKNDSTSFINNESDLSMTISTSELKYVEFRDVSRGAIGGLLMGLIGGLAFGLTAFYLMPEDQGDPKMSGIVIFLGPLIGGPIGLIIGAIKQDRNIFYINDAQ